MSKSLFAVLFVGAVVAAFLAGRFSASPPVDPGASSTVVAEHKGDDAGTGASRAETGPARVAGGAASSPGAFPDGVGSATASSPLRTDAGGMQSTVVGPQPLLPEDLPRLQKVTDNVRARGGMHAELLDLAEHEDQDEGARALEQRIAQIILRDGAGYTQLRLSPPHCTRSVCIVRGVGSGKTQNPRSAWQRLGLAIMNEPWWRESFDDSMTTVTGDGDDTLYVTLFVRCPPGTCRFGSR